MGRQGKDGRLSVVQAQGSVAEWTSTGGYEALGHYSEDYPRERKKQTECRVYRVERQTGK